MACATSSLLSEGQFQCSICLEVFTDPITTPCGHTYCNACITKHWDSSDVCKCPLCNKTFYWRPECSVNKVLAVMADQLRKTKELKKTSDTKQEPAKSDEVSCDVCAETKFKALKSCLVCQISYCETHLEPHVRAPALKRHKLIDPVKNLEDVMCKKHDRPLELFCKTDRICVCRFCTQLDHKSHQIVSLEKESDGKKDELEKTEVEVQKKIRERRLKIQEVKHTVALSKKDADREIADSVQVFTALASCIERSQAEVIDVIEEKLKTTEKQAEGFIKDLQLEIAELEKRSSELRQLSLTEDHLHLLQNFTSINTPPPTKDWTKVHVHQLSYVDTVRKAVAQLKKTLSKQIRKLRNAELRRIQQYAVDVTLDPDTAQPCLILSEDGKHVSHGDVKKNLPDYTNRFCYEPSVLGKQSFSSGRSYYEVQVKGKTAWTLGVARESINRKELITATHNNGYWTIHLSRYNGYKANASPAVLLPVRKKLQKVGVFVDYEEGVVAFYDVETRVHLYSFTGCSFTEKLYPFFSPELNDGGRNSAPLIISQINHSEYDLQVTI